MWTFTGRSLSLSSDSHLINSLLNRGYARFGNVPWHLSQHTGPSHSEAKKEECKRFCPKTWSYRVEMCTAGCGCKRMLSLPLLLNWNPIYTICIQYMSDLSGVDSKEHKVVKKNCNKTRKDVECKRFGPFYTVSYGEDLWVKYDLISKRQKLKMSKRWHISWIFYAGLLLKKEKGYEIKFGQTWQHSPLASRQLVNNCSLSLLLWGIFQPF